MEGNALVRVEAGAPQLGRRNAIGDRAELVQTMKSRVVYLYAEEG